jgi:DinB superfamily
MDFLPQPNEYAPYYGRYVQLVRTDVSLYDVLREQLAEIVAYLEKSTPTQLAYRYAEGKWSVAEAMVHLIDAERIFAYRALRIARGDETPLPGFEQDDYVLCSHADGRSSESLLAEYRAVREATLQLFYTFDSTTVRLMGTASDKPISVRALMYIIAGHELHHLNIFKEKYFI